MYANRLIALVIALLMLLEGGALPLAAAEQAGGSASSSSNEWVCNECKPSHSFRNNWNLKEHKKRVHQGYRVTCNICGKSLATNNTLMRHIKNVHKDSDCPPSYHSCAQCTNRFYTLDSLLRHKRRHKQQTHIRHKRRHRQKTRRSNTLNRCKICNYISAEANFKKHKHTHTGEKPFQCKHCSKGFSDSSNRNRHEKICRNRYCPYCSQAFRNKQKLESHKETCSSAQEEAIAEDSSSYSNELPPSNSIESQLDFGLFHEETEETHFSSTYDLTAPPDALFPSVDLPTEPDEFTCLPAALLNMDSEGFLSNPDGSTLPTLPLFDDTVPF